MTLTLPTVFDEMRENRAANACFIVSLTDGTDTWYFADQSLNLTGDGVQVEALVQSVSGLSHGFDPYTSQYQTASVDVVMSNLPSARRDSAPVWKYTAERLDGIWAHALIIYLFPGTRADAIADCLKVYTGTVNRIYTSGASLVIESSEFLNINHRILPQRRLTRSTFRNLPYQSINRAMPLAYGSFAEGTEQRQTGFVQGELIDTNKWLIADHEADAMTDVAWFYLPQVESWAGIITGDTQTADDSGRATLALTDAFEAYAFLYPFRGACGSTAEDGSNDVGPHVAWDHDDTTKFSVIAHSTTEATATFEWNQQGDSADDSIENAVAILTGDADVDLAGIEYYRSKADGVTISSYAIAIWDGSAWYDFDTSNNLDARYFNPFYNVGDSEYDWGSSTDGIFWHLGSGPKGGDGTPTKIRFTFTGSGWTANSTVVAYIHELLIRLRIKYARPDHYGVKAVRRGGVPARDPVWDPNIGRYRSYGYSRLYPLVADQIDAERTSCGIDGRPFGSWIDDGARSNNYNEGALINLAPSIVESLLRDEFGFANSDIDVDSFDDLYPNSANKRLYTMTLMLNEDNKQNSGTLIDRICFEDGLALYRRQNGEWRIIDIVRGTGTSLTMYPDDLGGKEPVIWKSDVRQLVNKITVYYRMLPHDRRPERTTIVEDATSQSTYGIIEDEFTFQTKWSDDSLTYWKQYMLTNAAARLLSRPHRFVRLDTVGIKWAHVELGDTINLDSTFDTTTGYCFGDSWNGLDLLVIRKEHRANATVFDCLIWAE